MPAYIHTSRTVLRLDGGIHHAWSQPQRKEATMMKNGSTPSIKWHNFKMKCSYQSKWKKIFMKVMATYMSFIPVQATVTVTSEGWSQCSHSSYGIDVTIESQYINPYLHITFWYSSAKTVTYEHLQLISRYYSFLTTDLAQLDCYYCLNEIKWLYQGQGLHHMQTSTVTVHLVSWPDSNITHCIYIG